MRTEISVTDQSPTLDELLERLVTIGGSDLHLKVGSPPSYRVDGALHAAEMPVLGAGDTERLLNDLLPSRFKAGADYTVDLDFAYGRAELGRFRVNSYRQRGSVSIVVRSVAPTARTLGELGLPPVVARPCEESDGLILVTGPAGSGKTTTCAGMVDHINRSRRASIITIEDPIEVLHRDKMAIVSQREVGVDTPSYREGMASAMRQDPDVIYVGEMRDQETIEAALVAAETGHLVISTMYTLDALETVHRILDSFPPYLERRVRQMLGTTLRAIVSQRLIPKAEGKGRTLVAEVLINTEAVREVLVDPDATGRVPDIVAEGAFYGMQSLDQAITEKCEAGEITYADALMHVAAPREFKLAIGMGQKAPQ